MKYSFKNSSFGFKVLSVELRRFLNLWFKNMPQLKTPNSKLLTQGLSLGLVLCGLALVIGCQTQSIPTPANYSTPSFLVNQSRVDQFAATGGPYINPNLFELNNPPTYILKDEVPTVSPGSQAGFVVVVNFKSLTAGSGSVQGCTGCGTVALKP